MPIDELLIALGFEFDKKELDRFQKELDSTIKLAEGLVKAITAATVAITGMVIASTKATDEQAKFANEIGETVGVVDALQFALQRSGGSADGMTNSLRALTSRAAEAARGAGAGVEAFGLLGISVTNAEGDIRKTTDLLFEVSQQFQFLSRGQQIELAEKLGIRDSIRLLQQGPTAIRNLINEAEALGVTTEEDARLASDFQDSLTDLWQILKEVTRILVRQLVPIMESVSGQLESWWKNNRQLVEQRFVEWVTMATSALKALSFVLGALIGFKVLSTFGAFILLLGKATAAVSLLNAATLLIPALIGAAIAALVLLAEDAKVFFEGGESFIGDMIKQFPEFTSWLQNTAAVFATLADLTTLIFDGWSKIFDIFRSGITVDKIKETFSNIPGFLGDITGLSSFGQGSVTLPVGNQTSTAVNVGGVNISVSGAGLPEEVGREVFNIFQQSLQDLYSPVDQ